MSPKHPTADGAAPRQEEAPHHRRISLALQGGGAHGAFTWGVLDRLLEDPRIIIEAVSGTSAGAMNAAALVAGYSKNGAQGAREALDRFWSTTSEYGLLFNPARRTWADQMSGAWNLSRSPGYAWAKAMSQYFSPYQTNPLNYQPLREILAGQIDIEAARACAAIKLFVTATNVRTGRARVFSQDDLSLDALLASACLPQVSQAIEIDGDPYWDGGYMGNPSIWPLIYKAQTADVVLVQINPLTREGVPRTAEEIENRLDEIRFNSSLMHEMRAIAFVQRLLAEDALVEPYASKYKNMRIHMIGDETLMKSLDASSKSNTENAFLQHLKQAGRDCADQWLADTYADLGKRSSIKVRDVFL